MERNWLIRTSQKQILGPIAKAKVLEFMQKGALGLNDEVMSGNGYWFALKEKELVDKYLFGDLPQSYNPISESKSVLSKRENPDKTTSINSAPANKTQVLRAETLTPGILPAQDDLEYPDITLLNTSTSGLQKQSMQALEPELRLPDSSDLEFPDIALINATINNTPHVQVGHNESLANAKSKNEVKASVDFFLEEDLIYPKSDDLEYPDMNNLSVGATEDVKKGIADNDDREFIVQTDTAQVNSVEKKNDFNIDEFEVDLNPKEEKSQKSGYDQDSKMDLVFKTEPNVTKPEKTKSSTSSSSTSSKSELKLLHERKPKAAAPLVPLEPIKPNLKSPADFPRSALPENLKKRNDNYLLYILIILILLILSLFFYYYRTILNKPLPV
jgi:hypothetical protein